MDNPVTSSLRSMPRSFSRCLSAGAVYLLYFALLLLWIAAMCSAYFTSYMGNRDSEVSHDPCGIKDADNPVSRQLTLSSDVGQNVIAGIGSAVFTLYTALPRLVRTFVVAGNFFRGRNNLDMLDYRIKCAGEDTWLVLPAADIHHVTVKWPERTNRIIRGDYQLFLATQENQSIAFIDVPLPKDQAGLTIISVKKNGDGFALGTGIVLQGYMGFIAGAYVYEKLRISLGDGWAGMLALGSALISFCFRVTNTQLAFLRLFDSLRAHDKGRLKSLAISFVGQALTVFPVGIFYAANYGLQGIFRVWTRAQPSMCDHRDEFTWIVFTLSSVGFIGESLEYMADVFESPMKTVRETKNQITHRGERAAVTALVAVDALSSGYFSTILVLRYFPTIQDWPEELQLTFAIVFSLAYTAAAYLPNYAPSAYKTVGKFRTIVSDFFSEPSTPPADYVALPEGDNEHGAVHAQRPTRKCCSWL